MVVERHDVVEEKMSISIHYRLDLIFLIDADSFCQFRYAGNSGTRSLYQSRAVERALSARIAGELSTVAFEAGILNRVLQGSHQTRSEVR